MSEDKSWLATSNRRSIVNKINETLRDYNSKLNGYQMEYQFCSTARTKDEYFHSVAQFIIEVRNSNPATVQQCTTRPIRAMADSSNAIENLEQQGTSSTYAQVMSSGQQSAPIMSNQRNMFGGTMISLQNHLEEDDDVIFVGNLGIRRNRTSDADLCCICLDKSVNTALIPCGHLTLCYGCADKLSKLQPNRCPICRSKVDSFIKTYRP